MWSGNAKHSYGHLLFAPLEEGTFSIHQLQISHPEAVPHSLRCEGLLRVLSWASFDLPDALKQRLSSLLQAAGRGCMALHSIPRKEGEAPDPSIDTEQALQSALIVLIPTPGQ